MYMVYTPYPNNFENRSVLGKVRGKNIVAPFSGHGV